MGVIDVGCAGTQEIGSRGRLMNEVEHWAEGLAISELHLHVTSNNSTAQNFYEKCGFTRTGITQPYQNDPALFEYEMAKADSILLTTSFLRFTLQCKVDPG